MDSQHFVKPTLPSFKSRINEGIVKRSSEIIENPEKSTFQVDNTRYPGYGAPMTDARLVTDYKMHCASNVASPEYGNSIRKFMQRNGEAFIQTSRHRQAERYGSFFYGAVEPMPPKIVQKCDEFECNIYNTGNKYGLGIERDERVPSLFGTFAGPEKEGPAKKTPLTRLYEGGRNTRRGCEFRAMGIKDFDRKKFGATG